MSLTASPSTVQQSGLVNITWAGGSTNSNHDWVVFWQPSYSPKNDTNYVSASWRYTYGGMTKLYSGTASTVKGTIAIDAPADVGTYTVFYCLNGGYPCPISVQVNVIAATIPK